MRSSMKLSNLYKEIDQGEMSVYNIDNTFWEIKRRGIKEVEVTIEEMQYIVNYIIGNNTSETLDIILTGAVDMFLGVKLNKTNSK